MISKLSHLQAQKCFDEQTISQTQSHLAGVNEQLEAMQIDAESLILEAISKQKWWNFENKRELIFHSDTGLLMPNFNYVRHIKVSEWQEKQANFALHEIGKGQWKCLHDIDTYNFKENIWGQEEDFGGCNNPILGINYPMAYRGKRGVMLYCSLDTE